MQYSLKLLEQHKDLLTLPNNRNGKQITGELEPASSNSARALELEPALDFLVLTPLPRY